MKHLYSYFLIVAMLFAVGCDKDDSENDNPNGGGNGKPETVYTISVNPGSTTVPAEGETFSTVVSSSTNWTLSGGVSWCEPSKTSGSNGETVTFTVEPNTTVSERNVTYTFRCGDKTAKLTITQKQKDALTVTKSKYEVKAEGDNIKVEIKANIPFDYEIAPNCKAWITPLQTRSMTTSILTFSIAENTDTKRREGSIVIKSGDLSETISVYQAGTTPVIVITQDKYIVSDKGEIIKVEVSSNVEYTVEMPAVDWISESTAQSVSSHTHYYTISPNESYDQRSAQIIYKSKEDNALQQVVTITQVQKDALALVEKTSRFESNGGTLTVGVQHNVDFTVEIDEDCTQWIHQIATRALETDYLTFSISPNTTPDNREGRIVFRSKDGRIEQTHTVYQGQKNSIILSEKEVNLSDEKQTFSVEISANVDFEVTISEVAWLHPIETRALESHTLNYSVDANETYDERYATITVKNRQNGIEEQINIVQAQKDAIILGKDSYAVSPNGELLDLEVQSNVDYTVTVNDSWIHYIQTKALQTNTVQLLIEKDPVSNRIRTGSISLSSGKVTQTIAIVQISSSKYDACRTIYYTTKDNQPMQVSNSTFGANIISHTYTNGKWEIVCDDIITEINPTSSGNGDIHLTSITLPETLRHIRAGAFQRCRFLTEVTLPESVISIEDYAFCGSKIERINLPQGLISIGNYAFRDCPLTNISIPESVTSIGEAAFLCSDISSVTIPDGITSIAYSTFSRCSNLRKVIIPESVTSIGVFAFGSCYKLTNITIPENVTSIGEGAFSYCSALSSIIIPESVTSIGTFAFEGTNLTSITIPKSITSIPDYMFHECHNLTDVSLPEGITSIGNLAFEGCQNLTNITIPKSVTQIGERAFSSCRSLTSITIPEGVTSIEDRTFRYCSSLEMYSSFRTTSLQLDEWHSVVVAV